MFGLPSLCPIPFVAEVKSWRNTSIRKISTPDSTENFKVQSMIWRSAGEWKGGFLKKSSEDRRRWRHQETFMPIVVFLFNEYWFHISSVHPVRSLFLWKIWLSVIPIWTGTIPREPDSVGKTLIWIKIIYAGLTVCSQVIKTALANPSESLKYE